MGFVPIMWKQYFSALLLVPTLLLVTGVGTVDDSRMSNKYEQQRYDGWYNNLAHPEWGSIESHLTRKTPPSYSDGVYQMSGTSRPSPRKLSQSFMKGKDGLGSLKNRTALGTFFGQVKFIFTSSCSSQMLKPNKPVLSLSYLYPNPSHFMPDKGSPGVINIAARFNLLHL